jgi:predicted amidohydrolase YtcJ
MDVVYTNGRIYTVDGQRSWAEAVAIRDGVFVAVGSNEEVDAVSGDDVRTVDLDGAFVMPGIHDTHVHPPLVYSFAEGGELLFSESLSKDEILDVVRKYADDHPDRRLIRGQKWSTQLFLGGKATKAWLDSTVSDRPVLLVDETGHNAVANTKALEMAGINADTPDPEFGAIDRDPASGEPSGYLSETAVGLVAAYAPRPDDEAFHRGIRRALDQIRAYGTTSIIDMAAGAGAIRAYKRLEGDGELNVRVKAAVPLNDYAAEQITTEEAEELLATRSRLSSRLVEVNDLKYWADGTPFSHTSLLLAPYADRPDTHGEMTIGSNERRRLIDAHIDGIQIHLHSVGDGTTRELLNWIAEAQASHPRDDLRHHIGHLMLVDPADIPRFKELNVAAEFSPVTWYPNPLTKTAEHYVGASRVARWQPIKEFVDAGAVVSFGSDWPAGTPDADPWRGLQAMVTRQDPRGDMPGTIGEPVDVATGIEILTMGGAKTMMHEDIVGSIEVGKYADMIILDRNPLEIDPTQIAEVQVRTTIFEGREVHTSDP